MILVKSLKAEIHMLSIAFMSSLTLKHSTPARLDSIPALQGAALNGHKEVKSKAPLALQNFCFGTFWTPCIFGPISLGCF